METRTFPARRKIAVVSILSIALVLLGVSMSTATPQSSASNMTDPTVCGSKAPPTTTLVLDWAYHYGSVANMSTQADAIVVGMVLSSESFTHGHACTIIYTRYTVLVKTALKGATVGTTISVVQTGGVMGSSKQEATDDPLINVGDEAVLFLRLDRETGQYAILSGPEGRFEVVNGLVYSLNVVHPDRAIDLPWKVDAEPLRVFLAAVG